MKRKVFLAFIALVGATMISCDGGGGSAGDSPASKCMTPFFSVVGGTYSTDQAVSITCYTTNSVIHYTTDGTDATESSPVYTDKINVSGDGTTVTISAMATSSGKENSDRATATYTIDYSNCASPTFSIPGGSYSANFTVVLSTTTSGGSIYYTTDGSTPTTSSLLYTAPVILSGNGVTKVIKAITAKSQMNSSPVVSETYTIADVPNSWTWAAGKNTPNNKGIYGRKGVADINNTPGSRVSAASCVDNEGNFILFGGYGTGFDYWGTEGYLNDLWKFNPTTGEWTWLSGSSSSIDVKGVYGTVGVASASNYPGSRSGACCWADDSGNIWVFGGVGYDSNNDSGYLNDLWKFSNGQWTWVSGSKTIEQQGVYGTRGVPSASNTPGARDRSAYWKDSSGNFWMFGGTGYDSTMSAGELNDLWMLNPSTRMWTWVSGSATEDQRGVYGTKGTPASGNVPGGRNRAIGYTDSTGAIWIFGGYGLDGGTSRMRLNDLWKFESGQWTWVSGSSLINQSGVYGIKGQPDAANVPGARTKMVNWIDEAGNLWIFSGEGLDSAGVYGELNDLWMFNRSTGKWLWISGSKTVNEANVYGTLRAASSTSIPGGRAGGNGWVDSSNNFWIFGGGDNESDNLRNDLWKYVR
jgi:N-acetylneuraminic acid mutarotase